MLTRELGNGAALRLLEESDADELAQVVDDNRAYLARWMPWAIDDTVEDTLAFIRRGRRQIADNDGMYNAIVVDGRIAGTIGVQGINWRDESTELGYWIAERLQGRGIVTEAVRAHLDHAFTGWRLHRVEIHAAVENSRSRAIPERLGFTEEGRMRQAERYPDRRHDLVLYAMLAPEWAARRAT